MNQAQQAALEGLVGVPLTVVQIAAIDPYLDPDNRNDVKIAELVNAYRAPMLRTVPVEEVFTLLFASGDWLKIRQAEAAGTPLATLAFSALEDAKRFGAGTVDLELKPTMDLLNQLRADDLLSQAGLDALTAASTVAQPPYHYNVISDALNIAEGRKTP